MSARVRLYVANLPYTATDDDVRWLFEQNGFRLSDSMVVRDRDGNRSRGYGFIELRDPLAAANCIRTMNGALLGERPIRVEQATPRRARVAA
jgi:RNA recognition motif-containing protein